MGPNGVQVLGRTLKRFRLQREHEERWGSARAAFRDGNYREALRR